MDIVGRTMLRVFIVQQSYNPDCRQFSAEQVQGAKRSVRFVHR